MKHCGVLRLSPAPHPYGWVATPLQGYLQQYVAGAHLYSWVENDFGAMFLNLCPGFHAAAKNWKKLQVNEKQWKRKIAIFVKTEKIAKIVKFAKFVESVKSTKCRSIGGGERHN